MEEDGHQKETVFRCFIALLDRGKRTATSASAIKLAPGYVDSEAAAKVEASRNQLLTCDLAKLPSQKRRR